MAEPLQTVNFEEAATISLPKPRNSLNRAKDMVSQQLFDLQNQMSILAQRRQELEEERKRERQKANFDILAADLQQASNLIGGIQSQEGAQARQMAADREAQIDQELGMLRQEELGSQELQRGLQASELGLLEREEQEAQEFQALENQQRQMQELTDPSSETSQQARQELAFLGISVPDNFSAAQIERNRGIFLEAQKQAQARALEDAKYQRDLQIELMKEERDLNKQLMMADRRDAATLAQAQKRRSEKTMENYFAAKDAIDLVNRGGNNPNPNQASDQALLEGYSRLLKDKATTYDEEGRPVINKDLLEQANSQIRVWQSRIKGNKGLLTPRDRAALVQEAQNLYEVEQGFNVKKLSNIVDWSNQMSKKNPNINAEFVVPGINQEVLAQELQEFFPDGQESYLSSAQRAGVQRSSPQGVQRSIPQREETVTAEGREMYTPGQTQVSSGGRRVASFDE